MKRRINNSLSVVLPAALCLLTTFARGDGKPNMIFILSDDLAQGDVAAMDKS